jgi:hypothetical protein
MRVDRPEIATNDSTAGCIIPKCLVWIVLLCDVSMTSAAAAWMPIANNEEALFYFNPDTIRYQVDLRSVWVIADRVKKGPDGELSVRMQYEIDCETVEYQVTYEALHTEQMAQGANLGTEHPNDWKAVTPGTAAELIVKKVCSR